MQVTEHEWVDNIPNTSVEVRVPPADGFSDFLVYDGDVRVVSVLKEISRSDGPYFKIRLHSGDKDEVSFEDLVGLPGGSAALELYDDANPTLPSSSNSVRSDTMRHSLRDRSSKRKRPQSLLDLTDEDLEDLDDVESSDSRSVTSATRKRLRLIVNKHSKISRNVMRSENESENGRLRPQSRRLRNRQGHRFGRYGDEEEYSGLETEAESLSESTSDDDLRSGWKAGGRKSKYKLNPTRRSHRVGRNKTNMRERVEDDIPQSYPSSNRTNPKVAVVKEIFKKLPLDNEFRHRHVLSCMACGDHRENRERGNLVFCQSCTYIYHEGCLGKRNGRDHLVTKVSTDNFVLQCRRCTDFALKKDGTAPRHSRCQACEKSGSASKAFRIRKSTREEQKDREENSGEDPVTVIDQKLLNNERNVLFRCIQCERAWHVHHLPAREESMFEPEDPSAKAEQRWATYCRDWMCLDCIQMPGRIGGLVAWRPKKIELFVVGMDPEGVSEDDKEYLVKWDEMSYFESLWLPGAWVWKMASRGMVIAFYKRHDGKVPPIMRTEEAIPEDYGRVDIVFEVRYNNVVADRLEEVDLARIREIDRAFVKYRGLGYEDAVWDKPPDPVQDPERWQDFKAAYNDWVRGRYIRLPASSTLYNNLKKVKALSFEEKVMLNEQPKNLKGGELMSYQLDGLNWLYYQWHRGQNAILADEMGLGKTIQVIAFILTLQEKHNCWPFLIVVPNATVANWKREIKRWAPSLRVVTYFGSAKAVELTEKYELFRDNSRDLSCHIVVTSYDAAQSQSCQRILRKITWQAQIVDEGQRLKNDKNILYGALSTMRSTFKLLLTGTPLQNNQRELFNLLQFLDPTIGAEALEAKYEVLTKENIIELHNMLRPFFLRRTKAQVLDFLPTMAQIIVPVTMTGLQRELYKTILAQNTDVLRSIFGGEKRASAKGGLRNILMQLRKCLCHPFVYNLEIEERSHEKAISHRRLVEASAKLQLLEIMLPMLQERGHRVLIFSQFLDMLTIMEDFLQDLGMEHARLDGSMGSLQKQKCIDYFNAPNSTCFAFLLSTRAGGVGINLASADTVIILDPDFNPHQDVQAISRAHRIGQTKKVLVFQMMTRLSAEEKIMQIGKRKMALDHALIDSMEGDEEDVEDVEAILRFGAEALFKNDDSTDIRYDAQSVGKLLDRSQVENTETDKDNSVESQFSFARIWQNETATMTEGLREAEDDTLPPQNVWDQILAERVKKAQAEAVSRNEKLGRGKRQRKDVNYHKIADDVQEALDGDDKSDTDFQAQESEDDSPGEDNEDISPKEVKGTAEVEKLPPGQGSKILSPTQPRFKRANIPNVAVDPAPGARRCPACDKDHPVGSCPLKIAGVENCPLCGLAHFAYQRTCPHLQSETQVRAMLLALQNSPEDKAHVDKAKRLLKGIKGSIVQQKKKALERARVIQNAASTGQHNPYTGPLPSRFPRPQIFSGLPTHNPPPSGYSTGMTGHAQPQQPPPPSMPTEYVPSHYYPGWPFPQQGYPPAPTLMSNGVPGSYHSAPVGVQWSSRSAFGAPHQAHRDGKDPP